MKTLIIFAMSCEKESGNAEEQPASDSKTAGSYGCKKGTLKKPLFFMVYIKI